MATIGLRDVHYALLVDDPIVGPPIYETPVKVIGAITANINPNASTATLFYDDGPGDTAATLGEISLELNLADIPLDVQAVWLGHTFANGVLKRKASDVPPWLAIGFRSLKSNGAYRYVWLNKGKFSIPEEAYQTKGDSIEFGTPTITGSFVKRDCDDEWQRTTDEDASGFDPSYIATWFTSPIAGTGASGVGNYGPTNIIVSALEDMDGTTLIIEADDNVSPGDETAVWDTDTLTVTLAHDAVYTRAALQTLINFATGSVPGALMIVLSGDLTADKEITATIEIAAA